MSGVQNTISENKNNMGIVDGRQDGQNPPAASVTLDTYVDKDPWDANARTVDPHRELPGATSKDVHESAGKPGSGMTSAELRHDGQRGRKKEGITADAKYGEGM